MGLVTGDTSKQHCPRWFGLIDWSQDCYLAENQKRKIIEISTQLSGGTHFHYCSPLSVCAVSANNFLNTFRGLCEVKFAICQDPGVDSIMYLGDWVGREPYQYEHLWVHLYLTYYIGFRPREIIFEIKLIVMLVIAWSLLIWLVINPNIEPYLA